MTLDRQKKRQHETIQRGKIALECIGNCGEVLILSVPPVSHEGILARFEKVESRSKYLILLMPEGRLELPGYLLKAGQ